jgi:hypothetical protein
MRISAILPAAFALLPLAGLWARQQSEVEPGERGRVTGIGFGFAVGYYAPDVEVAGGDGAGELFVRYTARSGLSASAGLEVGIPTNDNVSAGTVSVFVDPRYLV